MAIPKITKQDILDALKYIDENGMSFYHHSVKYDLVAEDGTHYSPKYVVAVAAHIANGSEITTEGFNAAEAKRFLESQGFIIEAKQQEKYVFSLIEDYFYHPMNKSGRGAQRLFSGNVGLIYPDFISRNNEKRIIADAKYKPMGPSSLVVI